jgi:hypothetical protein
MAIIAVHRATAGSLPGAAPTLGGPGRVLCSIMLRPVGPLPPAVYWRRRAVVAGGVLVVLLLGMTMCSGGGGGTNNAGLPNPADPGDPTPAPSVATMTVAPGTAGGPAPGPPTTPAGPVTFPGSGTAPGSPGPRAVRPCPDSAIMLTVSSYKPSYPVGDTPVLRLTIRNATSVTCLRDVGARQQQILVYAGRTRLWSSNDCYPDGGREIRALDPGQVVTSTVVWSGRSSRPGCVGRRVPVGAGTYQVVGQLGALRSTPVDLVLA